VKSEASTSIAAATHLYRWTRYRSVRTEHAAIARVRPKALATALAVIEKLASVRRHFFGGLMTALRAGDCGNFDQFKWHSYLISILGQSMTNVRFTPKSGHVRCTSLCLLWANSGHCSLIRSPHRRARVMSLVESDRGPWQSLG
jgi:hypothetical protein